MTDRETGLAGGSLQARSENEVRTSNSSNNASTITTQAAARHRGGRRHRQKGNRVEREIVEAHRAIGVHAERYPLSGASRFRGAGHDIDLYLFGRDQAPAVVEVKSRKNGAGFTTLEKWLGEYDALFLRRNHADPMIVLPWRVWAALLKQARS